MNTRTHNKLNAKPSVNTNSYRPLVHAAKAGGIVSSSSERSSGRLRQGVLTMLLATAIMLTGLLSVKALADESHSEVAYNKRMISM